MKKIVLTGYMGCGKSLISKILAQKLNLNHLDLDELIEKNEGISIKEIFKSKGELYFRKTEHLLFNEILDSNQNFVLSLGGGTPCYYENSIRLKEDGIISIYLKASINTLVERLYNQKENRPLIANFTVEELTEYISKHLFERNFYYLQSKHTVNVDDKTPEEIIDELLQLV